MPSGFVRKSASPGRAPAFGQTRVGMHGADDGEAVLRLVVAQRVPAGEQRAGRAHLLVGAVEDRARPSRVGSSSGNAATESASSGVPPIAKTSLSAFVAAIAPKSPGRRRAAGRSRP